MSLERFLIGASGGPSPQVEGIVKQIRSVREIQLDEPHRSVGSRGERKNLGELLRWLHISERLAGAVIEALAMRLRSPLVRSDRSVPFGMYWRKSPLVFSFEPRCQGL
jgi:hypothetical protein